MQPNTAELTRAVVEVWSTVLDRPVGEDDELRDAGQAVHVVTLLNQWLGAELAVWQVVRARTPRGLAGVLAAAGVSPRGVPPVSDDPGPGREPVVDKWQRFWNATYRFSGGEFNTAGWFDSRSLTVMPEAHMREWVRETVERVRSLSPASVVDVGCGVGLILFPLAPHCSRYVGVDLSAEAIERLRSRLGALPQVTLAVGEASEVARLVNGSHDLLMLNSVIQYFPNHDYLHAALTAAAGVAAQVFLGDLRNADLRHAAHATLVADRFAGGVAAAKVRAAVAESDTADDELFVAPGELPAIAAGVGLRARTLVRRGAELTEMNRFRFDALLSPDFEVTVPPESPWTGADALADSLSSGAERLVLRDVPDLRTHSAVRLATALDIAPDDATLADVRAMVRPRPALDPEDVWRLGGSRGYGVAVAPSARPGHVDIAFWLGQNDWTAATLLA